ncbi:hypothetical protein OH77DRAFT_880223 [Trametes cingulata]|nr:hypothetical protein OH77DRAFT_880223 [Trametes cingulata]
MTSSVPQSDLDALHTAGCGNFRQRSGLSPDDPFTARVHGQTYICLTTLTSQRVTRIVDSVSGLAARSSSTHSHTPSSDSGQPAIDYTGLPQSSSGLPRREFQASVTLCSHAPPRIPAPGATRMPRARFCSAARLQSVAARCGSVQQCILMCWSPMPVTSICIMAPRRSRPLCGRLQQMKSQRLLGQAPHSIVARLHGARKERRRHCRKTCFLSAPVAASLRVGSIPNLAKLG